MPIPSVLSRVRPTVLPPSRISHTATPDPRSTQQRRRVYFRVFLVVVLLRSDPSADKMVADGVRQRQVVVPRRGHVSVLDDRVVDMPAERLLDVGDVLDHGDAANADLLPPVVVRLHLRGHLSSHLEMSPRRLNRPRPALLYANGPGNGADTFRRPCQVLATLTGLVFASTAALRWPAGPRRRPPLSRIHSREPRTTGPCQTGSFNLQFIAGFTNVGAVVDIKCHAALAYTSFLS